MLVSDLKRIADGDRHTRDYTVNALRRAVVEIVARFPVYRSYLDDAGVDAGRPRASSRRRSPRRKRGSSTARPHGARLHRRGPPRRIDGPARTDPDLLRRFRRRFQQLTGPVMAKSLEDTLFYRFVPPARA